MWPPQPGTGTIAGTRTAPLKAMKRRIKGRVD
jgi:hypothetical protein